MTTMMMIMAQRWRLIETRPTVWLNGVGSLGSQFMSYEATPVLYLHISVRTRTICQKIYKTVQQIVHSVVHTFINILCTVLLCLLVFDCILKGVCNFGGKPIGELQRDCV